ncbi:MAG: hypothetical protein HFJ46_08035 [Clostridia bacterium]|nr:hypothetical protein [Clostridia bacterium]
MEYLYLKWIDYKTNKKYLIGALFRDKEKNKYYFKLSQNHIEKAIEENVISKQMLPFSDFDKIYESDEIFAIFKIRLPKIEKFSSEELRILLEDLEMKEYDEFEYLRKTNGILMTDNFIVEEEK